MKPGMEKRLAELEAAAGLNAVRTIWDAGQDIEAAIAGMVAEGKAAADDRFIAVGWRKGVEVPMSPEPFRDWPSRDAVPPAANDP
jgi:hypothetical protein